MQQNPKQTDGQQTKVRKVRIDSEQAGQRIDNFLRRELPGVPKGRIYRLLRRGEVRVNGGRIRAEYKLADGDEVRIPPARYEQKGAPPSEKLATAMPTRSCLRTSGCWSSTSRPVSRCMAAAASATV